MKVIGELFSISERETEQKIFLDDCWDRLSVQMVGRF